MRKYDFSLQVEDKCGLDVGGNFVADGYLAFTAEPRVDLIQQRFKGSDRGRVGSRASAVGACGHSRLRLSRPGPHTHTHNPLIFASDWSFLEDFLHLVLHKNNRTTAPDSSTSLLRQRGQTRQRKHSNPSLLIEQGY